MPTMGIGGESLVALDTSLLLDMRHATGVHDQAAPLMTQFTTVRLYKILDV